MRFTLPRATSQRWCRSIETKLRCITELLLKMVKIMSILLYHFHVFFIELGLTDGHTVVVADVTTPKPLTLTVKFLYDME